MQVGSKFTIAIGEVDPRPIKGTFLALECGMTVTAEVWMIGSGLEIVYCCPACRDWPEWSKRSQRLATKMSGPLSHKTLYHARLIH